MRIKMALDYLSTALVIASSGYLLWTLSRSQSSVSGPEAQPVSGLTIPADRLRHVRGGGSKALIEFTDYECPFCRAYAREVEPRFVEQFVKRGLVRQVIVNFPLEGIHGQARRAGIAAECADRQGKYWDMHERLFTDQQHLDESALLNLALDIGLESAAFSNCLADDEHGEIASDLGEGRRLGVNGTPTFFVGTFEPDGGVRLNTRLGGAMAFARLKEMLETNVVRPNTRLNLPASLSAGHPFRFLSVNPS